MRGVLLVLADTLVLGAAVAWGVLASPFGLAVWAGLCLAWMRDVLLLSRERSLLVTGLLAAVLVPVPWMFALGRLDPTAWVAAAVLVVLLVLDWLLVLGVVLERLPRRLRRGGVAHAGVGSALVALAAGAVHAGAPWAVLAGSLAWWLGDLLRLDALRRRGPAWPGAVASVAALALWAWAG